MRAVRKTIAPESTSIPQRYRPNYDAVCGEDKLVEPLGGLGRLSDSPECFTS